MQKLTALGCFLGWSGFWVFGYVALSSLPQDGGQAAFATLLAGFGFLIGVFTYLRLGRNQRA